MSGWNVHDDDMSALAGKTVAEIHANTGRLVLVTDDGSFGYRVVGECCSTSYFYDFIGVEKLLAGPVVSVDYIELGEIKDASWDVTEAYGFKFVTLHPLFGEVTSALSFRNDSNGYYGGWMEAVDDVSLDGLYRITSDVLDLPSFVDAECKAEEEQA